MSDRAMSVVREVQAAVPTWSSRLSARRRIDSPFAGLHPTNRRGAGEEWSEARSYEPGDDVRRIDWSATARSSSVQVRDTLADRNLRLTLALDCSGSMSFGTCSISKADLALASAAAAALVCARQGDATSALLATPSRSEWLAPGTGTDHVNIMLRKFISAFGKPGPVNFTEALRRTASLATSAGVVLAVSDFLDPGVESSLRRLAASHRTIAVVVEDPRELELVGVGNVEFVDPETLEVYEVETDSALLRSRFVEVANRRRSQRLEALVGSGAEVVILRCGPDWLKDVALLAGRLA
jgi:uncharacterized protein (DUF58 family)